MVVKESLAGSDWSHGRERRVGTALSGARHAGEILVSAVKAVWINKDTRMLSQVTCYIIQISKELTVINRNICVKIHQLWNDFNFSCKAALQKSSVVIQLNLVASIQFKYRFIEAKCISYELNSAIKPLDNYWYFYDHLKPKIIHASKPKRYINSYYYYLF